MYINKATRKNISKLVLCHRVAIRKDALTTEVTDDTVRAYTTGYMIDYLLGVDTKENADLLRSWARNDTVCHAMVWSYAPELLNS